MREWKVPHYLIDEPVHAGERRNADKDGGAPDEEDNCLYFGPGQLQPEPSPHQQTITLKIFLLLQLMANNGKYDIFCEERMRTLWSLAAVMQWTTQARSTVSRVRNQIWDVAATVDRNPYTYVVRKM